MKGGENLSMATETEPFRNRRGRSLSWPVAPLIVVLAMTVACPRPSSSMGGVVTKVYDGDTLLISKGEGASVVVRLVAIDAPERSKTPGAPSQPFSRKSRDYLSSRVKGRQVTVRSWGNDRYGRLLGEIYVDGENINIEMVRQGLAEVYRGRPPEGLRLLEYRSAESRAREYGIGIWSQGSRYVSPVEWKHPPR